MVPHNTPIHTCSIEQIVDCINTGIYGDLPSRLISFYDNLTNDRSSDFLRVIAVPYLFHETDKIFKSDDNPIPKFKELLEKLLGYISGITERKDFQNLFSLSLEEDSDAISEHDVALATGVHYGNLFKNFDLSQYLEAKELLHARLERNDIKLPKINEAILLDQGCGGGRYTIAWKLLGVKQAIGLDISSIGLEDAKNKLIALKLEGVEFVSGSVLDLKFSDNFFDIVFSNGVLHHTDNWERGIDEQLRVLKPGGFGWQYLIENPGGIFWDKIEILRAILKKVNKNYAQKVMSVLGVPSNRIFYMLDHVMVSINSRITEDELSKSLIKAGAKNLRRLERGTDFDRVEMIHRKVSFAREKFGVGENRFIFSK